MGEIEVLIRGLAEYGSVYTPGVSQSRDPTSSGEYCITAKSILLQLVIIIVDHGIKNQNIVNPLTVSETVFEAFDSRANSGVRHTPAFISPKGIFEYNKNLKWIKDLFNVASEKSWAIQNFCGNLAGTHEIKNLADSLIRIKMVQK